MRTHNACAALAVSISVQMGSCFFPGTSADPPSRAAERKGGMWKGCEAQLGILGEIQLRQPVTSVSEAVP